MIPRPEHPEPQWERKTWRNLNGTWEFDFDFSKSAKERELHTKRKLNQTITVPFCPESELSGIGYRDYMHSVCYRKVIELSEAEIAGRVLLHFGAVDYEAEVYINGQKAGSHTGGYTPFVLDITELVTVDENEIFVYAEDDAVQGGKACCGKQSDKSYSYGCYYTRTTGIWQTVWLEFVPEQYLLSAKYYPDTETPSVTITGTTVGCGEVKASAFLDGKPVGVASAYSGGTYALTIPLSEKRLWEVGKGGLYDLELSFGEDTVRSYFGLRNVCTDKHRFLINNKSVFMRLVLDQGFYPKGIYTAPEDSDLQKDITLSMAAGFNGARLHEKVFEPRFLYYADKMGYPVWGEYPNWGIKDYSAHRTVTDMLLGWTEAINRDFNHPSIILWCPFNETWGYQESKEDGRFLETVYHTTKALDSTRPCIDASGAYHAITDLYDVHGYTQDPEKFASAFTTLEQTGDFTEQEKTRTDGPIYYSGYAFQKGMPFIVSEYGGIRWDKAITENNQKTGWGYGEAPQSESEFIDRYRGLTEALLRNPYMCGFCYTQLYDVEQEKNGLYTYAREPKFEPDIFRKINTQMAAIEE